MSEQNNVKWHEKHRILYIEPNDVYGHVNGVPMTPDYSDYCVSVNLIAEVVSRQKQSGKDSTKTYCITWTQPPKLGDDGQPVVANNWISFLKGEDAKVFGGPKDESFLTTYYTDINFDDIVKKNIVEGLGIESVQVSFESYYTPTIVIKFVDVRGSSLFGREEVAHNNNEDLSSSSVFGVFFTVPYPKFKLQIKGFYGRAVTYQLTCSDFKASFNSQTGNFEAVATFIGYSYSLLTDIPLRYLVAAPFCKYAGQEYWEKKLNSAEWALSDGKSPKTLFDIIQTVKSLLTNTDKVKQRIISDDDSNIKNSIESEKALLRELGTCLNNYVVALKKLNQTETSINPIRGEGDEEQLLLFAPAQSSGNFKIAHVGDDLAKASNDLEETFTKYNTSYPLKKFSDSLLPNGKHQVFRSVSPLEFSRLCKHIEKDTNGNITKVVFNTTQQTEEALTKIKFGNDVKLTKATAKKLLSDSVKGKGLVPKYFGEFCYVVNLNCFNKKIYERITELDKQNNEIDKKVAQKVQSAAAMDLDFTPCMGDVFKIIMCHLETFVHMMWSCYRVISDEIPNGLRSPDSLGIDLSMTDIPFSSDGEKVIYPWPGIFGHGKETGQGGDIDEAIDYITWVGDLSGSHEFEEEKLVKELYVAAQRLGKKYNSEVVSLDSISDLPVLPNDLNNFTTVFNSDIQKGVSALSGYLSFRAAQIFGVFMNETPTSELAKTFGVMDAYNYFNVIGSRSEIQTGLIEATANKGNLADIMLGVAHCEKPMEEGFYVVSYQENGRSVHDFETVCEIEYPDGKKIDRHPMFVRNGNDSEYVHYYTKDNVGLIPDRLKSYSLYRNTFGKSNNGRICFNVKNATDTEGFIHKSTTKSLFNGITNGNQGEYINTDMFDVNMNNVDSVITKYEEMKSGTFRILGDTYSDDLSVVINKFWHVGNDDYGRYFGDNKFMLSLNSNDRGINTNELYPNSAADADNDSNAPLTYDNEKIFELSGGVKYDSSKNSWVADDNADKPISNLCVRFLQSNYLLNTGSGYETLFASKFYYHQNDIVILNDKEKDDGVMRLRQNRVKALLFLHSLKYDYRNIAGFLDPNKNNGGIYALPFGYVLLLGGLLWRQKYYNGYGKDPIQTSEITGKYQKYVDGKVKECNSTNEYKPIGIEYTLFREINGRYVLCPLRKNDNASYTIRVSKLFGVNNGDKWMPDEYVTNRLVTIFESFVDNQWSQKLIAGLELKNVTTINDNRIISDFYGNTFGDIISRFTEDFKLCQSKRIITIGNKRYEGDKGKALFMLTCLRNHKYFTNFFGNYRYISLNKDGRLLMLLNEDNTEIQDILKDVFTKKVIVTDSSGIRYYYDDDSNNVKEIKIKTETLKAYFSGFENKIKELSQETRSTEVNGYDDDYVTYNRDLLLPIYIYLKMIWDKWLVSTTTKKFKNGKIVPYEDYYNVENFYNSFVFIDAFYKNIYKKFIINLETLKKSYEGRDADGSLFQFIGDITKEHNCLFLALPDYVDMGNADNKTAVDNLMNIFTPIPYNRMNEMEDENKFVVIYTPRMSEVPSSMNGYREDYFKIWNPAVVHENGEIGDWADGSKMFSVKPVNDGSVNDVATRYGYYVPSFGVSFGRQNNSLFKSINLNMTTPLVTSASINATANIAQAGSGAPHKAAFVGQDLYPVYSNYSYICEIEMMGDAQIQPLMYFQLMNIPMWSGVYMIFNVTHVITPGNMVTRFKGMKLSRNPLPYNSSWYMFSPDAASDAVEESGGYSDYTGDDTGAGEYYSGAVDYSGLNNYEITSWPNGDPQKPSKPVKTSCDNQVQKRKYYILRCMDYFTSNGLTIAQAGGIVGNFMAEGLPCFAQRWQKDNKGWAFGLSMMNTNGAFYPYQEYCKSRNMDWRAINPQLVYIYNIVKGNVKGYDANLVKAFSNEKISTTDAAYYFARYYERCKECILSYAEAQKNENIKNRMNNAKEAVNLFNKHRTTASKGNLGDGKPLLVGDSWGVGMSSYFKQRTGGVSAAVASARVGNFVSNDVSDIIPSAAEQIKNNIKNKPKYILLYAGLNSAWQNSSQIERMFDDCCNNAGNTRIYVCYITYVGDGNGVKPKKDANGNPLKDGKGNVLDGDVNVRKVNTAISKVCSRHDNAIPVQLSDTEMSNFRKKYCPKTLHPSSKGYEELFNMIMSKIKM